DSKEPYSVGLADEFEKKAKDLGVKTTRDGVAAGGKDYSAIVTKVKAANPDALFFPNQGPECPLILQEMRKQAVKFKFMSSDGCHDASQMIKAAQGAGDGMFVSDIGASYDATPEGKAWGAQYKQKFNEDPAVFTSYAYDATRIVLQAIQNAAKTKGGLNITSADVNQQIGHTKGFAGLLGSISFDPKGDVQNPAIYIYQVAGSDFKLLKSVSNTPSSASASGAATSASGSAASSAAASGSPASASGGSSSASSSGPPAASAAPVSSSASARPSAS
ncbi:MAG: branched-chain amino acid ABC transporter substrate-binding protein, partial [Chloroflexi bacterium]|nr:branched-chain amino acid ABC transporter substrate-binding protein [Chloroflexota bacterium]